MADFLDWTHDVVEIPIHGLSQERSANETERRAIADALGLISLDALTTEYRVTALAGGGYRLAGAIAANVVQSCIVSLEPVTQSFKDTFDVEFWPEVLARNSDEDVSVLGGHDVEPLNHGLIEAGRIVFETLSGAIDPYPRKEGAAFAWQDDPPAGATGKGPFDILSRLKNKS